MLQHALGLPPETVPGNPSGERRKQMLRALLVDTEPDDITCALADYIAVQDEDVQFEVVGALVDACLPEVRAKIGESHFDSDRECGGGSRGAG
jgi:hypothetical protein